MRPSRYLAAAAEIQQEFLKKEGRLMTEIEKLRAEMQNAHEAWEALSAHAEKLRAENEALRRGEFICGKCGLRQPGESAGPVPF